MRLTTFEQRGTMDLREELCGRGLARSRSAKQHDARRHRRLASGACDAGRVGTMLRFEIVDGFRIQLPRAATKELVDDARRQPSAIVDTLVRCAKARLRRRREI